MFVNFSKARALLLGIFAFPLATSCTDHLEIYDVPECPIDDRFVDTAVIEPAEFHFQTILGNGKTETTQFDGHIIAKESWPVALIEVERPSQVPPDRTVIYFSGGPGNSSLHESSDLLQTLYADGFTTILIATHSGNVLGAFDGRDNLRTYGLSSVRCDAKLLHRLITPDLAGDKEVVVHSHSFGTLAALSFISSSTSTIDKLVLQGPWLYPVPVEDIVQSHYGYAITTREPLIPLERQQIRPEIEAVYRELFKLDLESPEPSNGEKIIRAIRGKACQLPETRVFLAFAEYEDRVDVSNAKAFAVRCFGDRAQSHVAKAAPHGSEFATRGARQRLDEFLDRKH